MKIRKNIQVGLPLGLHLRPASGLVKLIQSFKSQVTIIYEHHRANARSLMGLVAMAIGYGSNIEVEVKGDDAVETLDAITCYLEGEE